MTKAVYIEINACHRVEEDGEENVVVSTVNGCYYEKNNYCYIKYNQSLEEGGTLVPHLLKFSKDHVVMTKKVPQKMAMEFLKEKCTSCEYITPYGMVLLEIQTKSIELCIAEEVLLELDYVLLRNGEKLSECKMKIKTTAVL